MNFKASVSIAVAAYLGIFYPHPASVPFRFLGNSIAHAEANLVYHDQRILYEFAKGKDMARLNMLNGLLADLLREYNKMCELSGKPATTDLVQKVEGLLDEANVLASQGKYEEGWTTLHEAYKILKASLTEIGAKEIPE